MQFLPPPKGNGFPCYYFMKIKNVELVEILEHIGRKLKFMCISDKQLEKQVYTDILSQFKREFGINKESELDDKYLYDAHEFIDCYKLPLFLNEKILEVPKGNGISAK